MALLTQIPNLYILESPQKGRGVFCTDDIQKGSVIEICPVIVLNKKDTQAIHKTKLHDYYYLWDAKEGSSAIVLGFGFIYNHSENPNAEFELLHESQEVKFIALEQINAGTEITTNYIASQNEGYSLWFDPV